MTEAQLRYWLEWAEKTSDAWDNGFSVRELARKTGSTQREARKALNGLKRKKLVTADRYDDYAWHVTAYGRSVWESLKGWQAPAKGESAS